MRRATFASVTTAGVLLAVKLAAWGVTDSVSLLATLVDSMLDVAASLVNMLAVRQALVPADHEHRFGHGKVEPLAALGQAGFVGGSAIFLLFAAAQRFEHPRAIQQGEIGIAVMLFSIAATLALVAYQRSVVRRTNSLAIRADSLHYVGDLLVNAGVIAALLLSMWRDWSWVDPVFALCVSVYILVTAGRIALGALDVLMDRELPESDRDRVVALVERHPEVLGMHDLRTRSSGPKTFIQLHLELDGDITLYEAKAIADTVEAEIAGAFPGAEVIIHQDPHGAEHDDLSLDQRREAARRAASGR
jgi:ferrous-iron efflux pump FieF